MFPILPPFSLAVKIFSEFFKIFRKFFQVPFKVFFKSVQQKSFIIPIKIDMEIIKPLLV